MTISFCGRTRRKDLTRKTTFDTLGARDGAWDLTNVGCGSTTKPLFSRPRLIIIIIIVIIINIILFTALVIPLDDDPTFPLTVNSGGCPLRFYFANAQFTYDHGAYTSEYIMDCTMSGTWTVQEGRCGGSNNGWEHASFPTLASLQAFANSLPAADRRQAWVGAKDVGQNRRWQWTKGRLAGKQFYEGTQGTVGDGVCKGILAPSFKLGGGNSPTVFKSCMWGGTEPDATGANPYCALLWPGVDMLLSDGNCEVALACTVCERSFCQDDVDCFKEGTARMLGTWFKDGCTCECLPNRWGTRCEFPFTTSHGAYETMHMTTCATSTLTFTQADNACKAIDSHGGGWRLGGPSTLIAANRFAAHLSYASLGDRTIYRMANPIDTSSEGRWVWGQGRAAGLQVASATATNTFSVTNIVTGAIIFTSNVNGFRWDSGEPNGGTSENCGFLKASGNGEEGIMVYGDITCASTSLRCYLCERSACTVAADCYSSTTASSAVGSFPFCTCVCKPGYHGTRCEYPVTATYSHFSTEYVRLCAANAAPSIAKSAANVLCQNIGEGWGLASVPLTSLAATIATRMQWINATDKDDLAWLGVTVDSSSNTYSWTHGRFKGLNFSIGSTCTAYTWTGATPSTQQTFTASSCAWNVATPTAQCAGLAESSGGGQQALSPLSCSSTARCYVCERSLCAIGPDCYAGRTAGVSGYFPNCKCRCKHGWRGPSCSLTTTMSLSLTRTLTATFSASSSALVTSSRTALPTESLSRLATETNTVSCTVSASNTLTPSPSQSLTLSGTATVSMSTTLTMSGSSTEGSTTVSRTRALTETRTILPTATFSASATHSHTSTSSISGGSMSLSAAPSDSHSAAESATVTLANTQTVSPTATPTPTPAISSTLSLTLTDSAASGTTSLSPPLTSTHSALPTLSPSQTFSLAATRHSPSTSETVSLKVYPPPRTEGPLEQAIGVIIVGGVVISPSGGGTAVALALVRAARCGAEEDPNTADEPLPMLVHPLRFSVPQAFGGGGRDGLAGQEQGAVIGNAIIIPLMVIIIIGGPIAWLVRVISGEPSQSKAYEIIGWPSVTILPFTVLSEGIGSSVMQLYYDGTPVSMLLGFVGLCVVTGVAIVWAWGLFFKIPYKLLHIQDTPLSGMGPNRQPLTGVSVETHGAEGDDDEEEATLRSVGDSAAVVAMPTSDFYNGNNSRTTEGGVLTPQPLAAESDNHQGEEDEAGDDVPNRLRNKAKESSVRARRSAIGVRYVFQWLLHARKEWVMSEALVDADAKRRREAEDARRAKKRAKKAESPQSQWNNSNTNANATNMALIADENDDEDDKAAAATAAMRDNRYKATLESLLLRFTNMISEKYLIAADLICIICSFFVGLLEGMETENKRFLCKIQISFMVFFALVQAIAGVLAFIPLELGFNIVQLILTLFIAYVCVSAILENEDGYSLPPETQSVLDELNWIINIIGLLGLVIGIVRTYSQIHRCQGRRLRRDAFKRQSKFDAQREFDAPIVVLPPMAESPSLDTFFVDETASNATVPIAAFVPSSSAPSRPPPPPPAFTPPRRGRLGLKRMKRTAAVEQQQRMPRGAQPTKGNRSTNSGTGNNHDDAAEAPLNLQDIQAHYEAFTFDDFNLPGRALTNAESMVIEQILGDFNEFEDERTAIEMQQRVSDGDDALIAGERREGEGGGLLTLNDDRSVLTDEEMASIDGIMQQLQQQQRNASVSEKNPRPSERKEGGCSDNVPNDQNRYPLLLRSAIGTVVRSARSAAHQNSRGGGTTPPPPSSFSSVLHAPPSVSFLPPTPSHHRSADQPHGLGDTSQSPPASAQHHQAHQSLLLPTPEDAHRPAANPRLSTAPLLCGGDISMSTSWGGAGRGGGGLGSSSRWNSSVFVPTPSSLPTAAALIASQGSGGIVSGQWDDAASNGTCPATVRGGAVGGESSRGHTSLPAALPPSSYAEEDSMLIPQQHSGAHSNRNINLSASTAAWLDGIMRETAPSHHSGGTGADTVGGFYVNGIDGEEEIDPSL